MGSPGASWGGNMQQLIRAERATVFQGQNYDLTDLVLAAREGDSKAVEALIESVQDRLYRFCIHLTSNPQVADDISQETLIRTIQNLHSVKEPARIMSWLFQVAKNTYFQKLRSTKREVYESEESKDSHLGAIEATQDTRTEVQQIMAELDPAERMILLLIDLEDYSYSEAAEVLGISENAVRSRLHRARKEFISKYQRA